MLVPYGNVPHVLIIGLLSLLMFNLSLLITRATPVGSPRLNLPFSQYIYLSVYLSIVSRLGKLPRSHCCLALLKIFLIKTPKAFEPSFVETEKSFKQFFSSFLKYFFQ